MTPAQFFAIESENQQNKMQQVHALGNQVGTGIRRAATAAAGFVAGGAGGAQMAMGGGGGDGGVIGSIFSSFADKKAMQAKASSYGKIGDILGDTMFSKNPGAMNALSQLKQTKDPYEAVMGYETLMGMIGPMSNMMMAQGRNQTTQQGQQGATDRMFLAEQLRRERELMNKPPQTTLSGGGIFKALYNQPPATTPSGP